MIPPASTQQIFADYEPSVLRIGEIVSDIIRRHCEERGYAWLARCKRLESIVEKIETGRYQSWTDIDDLYACSIIIPTVREEDDVLTFLNKIFEPSSIKRRGKTLKAPDVFRFDATRFVGKLKPNPGAERTRLTEIKFEVQIRTAFEHAWSVTTHAIYKGGVVVDWKRFRLAAQLKAAVEQLDTLILAFDGAAESINQHTWPEIAVKMKISEAIRGEFAAGNLPSEIEPSDWTRFCDNVFNLIATAGAYRDLRRRRDDGVEKSLAWVDSVLKKLCSRISEEGLSKIPRSVTLFQYIFYLMTDEKYVAPPITEQYVCYITPELLSLYPGMAQYTNTFRHA